MKKTEYDNIMVNHVNNKKPIDTPKDQLLNVLYPLQTNYRNAKNNIQKQTVLEEVIEYTKQVSDIEDLRDKIAETSNPGLFGNYGRKKNNLINTNFKLMTNNTEPKKFGSNYYVEVSDNDILEGGLLNEVPLIEKRGKNYISIQDFSNQLELNKFDHASAEGINSIISTVNDSDNFNRQGIFNNIKNNIVTAGNLESLINDDIFGGRNFKDDFIEAIVTSTYDELGVSLTKEEVARLDPTNDGKVSMQDAIVIYGKLVQDKDKTVNYITEYFTKFAEQNRTKPNLKDQIKEIEEGGEKPYDPYEFA